jgi:hypothetical protein
VLNAITIGSVFQVLGFVATGTVVHSLGTNSAPFLGERLRH